MKICRFVVPLVFLCLYGHCEAQDLRFAVLQPGQPGSTVEAQPIMDAMAQYLQARLNAGSIKGVYENRLPEALELVSTFKPRWGIVSLPFFVRYAETLQMIPLASTRPNDRSHDVWRLVVPQTTVDDWKALKGKVLGTMLFERNSAACLLFKLAPESLPMHLEGTSQPLMAIRKMAKGKSGGTEISGIVLDSLQYDALKALPIAQQLHVIHQSPELPTSPVVSFGPVDEAVRNLVRVLLDMKKDQEGQEVLQVLQTDGFGAPDEGLGKPTLRMEGQNARCAP
jgi:hypothetical protein